jgi:hypothetical protein
VRGINDPKHTCDEYLVLFAKSGMTGPDSEKWLGAMESEIESMHDNQVWNMVDPIDGVRPISCK